MKNNLIQSTGDVKPLQLSKQEFDGLTKRKKSSQVVAFTFEKTELPDKYKIAQRMRLCGKTLVYAENPTGGEPILVSAMRCGIRLCPSCSWIRAHMVFQNVYSIVTDRSFLKKQFIFLTLTVKNCKGENLEKEINRLLSAWQKLTDNKRQPFRKSFLGTFRAMEITYNPILKNYHPHIHAMAAVEPGYFRKSNENYLSQAQLRELWRDACGLDYLPQCRIEKVKNAKYKQVAEVAKYTVKTADYLNRPTVLETLHTALKGKRLIAYGGLFKTAKAKLCLPNEDDMGELPKVTVEELLRNPYIRKIVLEWDMGRYHFSPLQPSADLAEWLEPGRVIAEILRSQADAFRGQGGV